ncbi:plasmid mobilization protein [Caballeronia sp. KNU42]
MKIRPVHIRPTDLQARWRAYCDRAGVSQSEALRALMVHVLGDASQPLFEVQFLPERGRHQRIELRLTPSEYAASQQAARSVGLSPNRWIVALIRAHLGGDPQFGATELAALSESNSQLALIGRNLNQMARALNAGADVNPRCLALVEALMGEVDAHLDRVYRVMRANVERWGR